MADPIIPIAAGKAAAVSAYLARGGERVSKGGSKKPGYRYTSGPMKGKTLEQATQDAERLWDGAGTSIREKYAKRAGVAGALTPSEIANQVPANPTFQSKPTEKFMGGYTPGKGAKDRVEDLPTDERMHAQGKVNNPSQPIGDLSMKNPMKYQSVGDGKYGADGKPTDAAKPVGTPVTGNPMKDLPLDERMKAQGKVNAKAPSTSTYVPKNGDAVRIKDIPLGKNAPIVNVPQSPTPAPAQDQTPDLLRRHPPRVAPPAPTRTPDGVRMGQGIRPDGGLRSEPMTPNEKMMASRGSYQDENRALEERQKAYAAKEAQRVTMGDLSKASQGRPISEGMKMGVKPDGSQLTKNDLADPKQMDANFPRRVVTKSAAAAAPKVKTQFARR